MDVRELYGRFIELEATARYPVLTLPNLNETCLLTGQRFFVERLERQDSIDRMMLLGLMLQSNEQVEPKMAQLAIKLYYQNATKTFDLIYRLESYMDGFSFPTPKLLGSAGGELIRLLGALEIVGPVELLSNPRE